MNTVLIPNGVEAVEAEYREQVIDEYRGNPLIEALPDITGWDQVIERTGVYPPYHSDERLLQSHHRVHLVQRLFQVFQPLSQHLDLESRISRVIRQGYLARNPFSAAFRRSLHVGEQSAQAVGLELSNQPSFRTTAAGFTIVGVSGMGKTTAINRVLSLFPQIAIHSRYRDHNFSMYQLVWLKLDCPFDGSIKGLCIEFFAKVDNLLGTDYYRRFAVNARVTVDHMLAIMAQIARNTGLGLLVIDEIQHLSEAKSGGASKMLNFFVTLVNGMGVPVVLIGTMKAMAILQSEFRQARRGSGQGDMVWDRLQNDENWKLLMDTLLDYDWTRRGLSDNEGVREVLYDESQGIIDIAVKLIAMSQTRAILDGSEEVSPALIRKVARESLQLVRPMIEAVRSGDLRKIARYDDIAPLDYEQFVDKEKESAALSTKVKALQQAQAKRDQARVSTTKGDAIGKLVELGIPVERATKAIDKVQRKHPALTATELTLQSFALIAGVKDQETKSDTETLGWAEDDLRQIVAQGQGKGLSAYDALKESGLISVAVGGGS